MFEALLFEQVIDYQFTPRTDAPGVFTFSLGDIDYQARGYIAGFSRIRLDQDSVVKCSSDAEHTASPELSDILNALPTTPAIKRKLSEQLAQTIYLCQWNAEHLPPRGRRAELDYPTLESQLDEGHPYHPCFKARTGFSVADHQAYGPECASPIQLHWLAVRRDLISQSLPPIFSCVPSSPEQSPQEQSPQEQSSSALDDLHFWQQEIGLPGWLDLQQRMNTARLSWRDYTLLPIHPWQWHNLKTKALAEPLATDELVHLGAAGDLYQATISVRSLINISRPEKATIKLPMNMINTSSLRKLTPHSVCSAPAISHWLHQVVSKDQFFQQHPLILLNEFAGILVEDQGDHWQSVLSGQLGVIFRESLFPYLKPQQQALPFTAIYAQEHDDQPLIQPWIERYGLENWFSQLIDVAVIPVWHLLVKHGLAVEAHGQNMVLVHQDGRPQALILRDFHESVEYVEDYLAEPALKPDFEQLNPCYREAPDNEYYWMSSVEALRELIIDTLFVFNLSELACVFERHFDVTETSFWQTIYQRLQAYAKQGHCSQSRLDRMPINQREISTESLIAKKLADVEEDHFHHAINNPFAGLPPLSV
ncbi:siderophore biosynthesis protein IucA [Litoribrevibacter albus]|uniref:Siderophore biosynthesis protein IucA n=1 Tax=Litoribrevibacter albus TaxID=1473156 RepID=A0AA37W8S7_9GAMM|nr:siderophore biosynthesis protein IucA [Litoribrevibacter albus]